MAFVKSYLVPYSGYEWTKHGQILTQGKLGQIFIQSIIIIIIF